MTFLTERRHTEKVREWGVIISIALQIAALVFGAGKISTSLDNMSASLDKHTQQIQELMIDGASTKGDVKGINVTLNNHEVRITKLEDK